MISDVVKGRRHVPACKISVMTSKMKQAASTYTRLDLRAAESPNDNWSVSSLAVQHTLRREDAQLNGRCIAGDATLTPSV